MTTYVPAATATSRIPGAILPARRPRPSASLTKMPSPPPNRNLNLGQVPFHQGDLEGQRCKALLHLNTKLGHICRCNTLSLLTISVMPPGPRLE